MPRRRKLGVIVPGTDANLRLEVCSGYWPPGGITAVFWKARPSGPPTDGGVPEQLFRAAGMAIPGALGRRHIGGSGAHAYSGGITRRSRSCWAFKVSWMRCAWAFARIRCAGERSRNGRRSLPPACRQPRRPERSLPNTCADLLFVGAVRCAHEGPFGASAGDYARRVSSPNLRRGSAPTRYSVMKSRESHRGPGGRGRRVRAGIPGAAGS